MEERAEIPSDMDLVLLIGCSLRPGSLFDVSSNHAPHLPSTCGSLAVAASARQLLAAETVTGHHQRGGKIQGFGFKDQCSSSKGLSYRMQFYKHVLECFLVFFLSFNSLSLSLSHSAGLGAPFKSLNIYKTKALFNGFRRFSMLAIHGNPQNGSECT